MMSEQWANKQIWKKIEDVVLEACAIITISLSLGGGALT
jgi:hypothetical protein